MPNPFKEKKAIIFDFDGTIADTYSLHETAFRTALAGDGLLFDYADYIGMSTSETIVAIFQRNGRTVDETRLQSLVKAKRLLANQAYAGVRAFPGALEFIDLVYRRGLPLFVGSSGSRMNITAGIASLGLDSYFVDVVTSDDVSRSKPDPEIFRTLLERHGIDACDALVIEDAASGLEAAARAGIDAICVNPELTTHPVTSQPLSAIGFIDLIQEFKIL